jgi:hypothetical protein
MIFLVYVTYIKGASTSLCRRKLHCEEHPELESSRSKVTLIKLWRMQWVRHVHVTGGREMHTILVGNHEEKRKLGRIATDVRIILRNTLKMG